MIEHRGVSVERNRRGSDVARNFHRSPCMLASALRDRVAIPEFPRLTENLHELIFLELPKDSLNQRRRQAQLPGGPVGGEVRDGGSELQRQVIDDPRIESGIGDGFWRYRGPP